MEKDNQSKTYLSLLEDSSIKKNDILDRLITLTKDQKELIKDNDMDEDKFNNILEEKEELIKKVMELNDGFEHLYERVKEELSANKETYQSEIQRLQKLILEVTDKGVQLQVLEKRNKAKFEVYFRNKRKDIKDLKLSNDTVSNYYKNMANQNQHSSYFFDKKK